ncbi:transcription termination/antitermination protein NusG [Leifsonia virtsii]|uniref:Transcription termination/antitermination protein NusG n=1 Tax=Leifsonia virtsii TaxID=3035915 RepID=A0ABT8J2M5_9MICO|nr:transcription termination/antitermination protein NusG [Leifsonia virtsii]MDN4599227.1 transcription termination/antitermination protein NusG [Leifsonia virtsii]
MSETNRDDVDWAPAAEQSSEDDEAQTGNVLASEDEASDSAEHEALHVVADDGTEVDLDAVLDAMAEAVDPEADRAVDEALEVDSEDEAEAAQLAVEDEEEEAVADPYEAFRTELRSKIGKWYVIHSYAGFERRVKSNIENRMVSMNMEDYIYEVQVPMEDVVEIKNGQRKMVNRVRIPGYVLVRMDLNEDSWSVVRHTPGVTGFVGNAHNPTPLRFEEAFSMLKSLVQVEAAPAKGAAKGQKAAARSVITEVDFEIGETITIKEGSFAGLPGSISEIKPESGKLTVLVSLFERETPVELSFDQVTKQ